MGRSPCCSKEGLHRGAWTAIEDQILRDYINTHGEGRWRNLPGKAGLKRCGKSCRLRWLNYLRPGIKRGNITHDEEELIIRLHRLLGNRWSLIAGRLPGRTDNEIKNYWNTTLRKKVQGNPSSTLTQKQSTKSKEKKLPMLRPSVEAPPPPKMESLVIRTKAIRCTKVFFTPQANKAPSMVGDLLSHKELESESYNGQFSLMPGEDGWWDFMMDLNVEELGLSNLLDSDFSQPCHFGDEVGERDCHVSDLVTSLLH